MSVCNELSCVSIYVSLYYQFWSICVSFSHMDNTLNENILCSKLSLRFTMKENGRRLTHACIHTNLCLYLAKRAHKFLLQNKKRVAHAHKYSHF